VLKQDMMEIRIFVLTKYCVCR